jgi:diaminopropionate ammonia-lyase
MRTGHPVELPGSLETIMDGLSAGTVSSIAWPVLQHGVDACVAIPDGECAAVIHRLAQPTSSDPAVEAGESGVCGVASLAAILRQDILRPLRDYLELGPQTRVLAINTEGRIRS